jgi:nuclear-control-of-ATPase protein 2
MWPRIERDLQSPLKSAVTGTLVRSLLIQIQKVKVGEPSIIHDTMLMLIFFFQVDVDIAMDGIEKMLRSQQLT